MILYTSVNYRGYFRWWLFLRRSHFGPNLIVLFPQAKSVTDKPSTRIHKTYASAAMVNVDYSIYLVTGRNLLPPGKVVAVLL
jgi:hypothetical protein